MGWHEPLVVVFLRDREEYIGNVAPGYLWKGRLGNELIHQKRCPELAAAELSLNGELPRRFRR
jgi:hypothetical protein